MKQQCFALNEYFDSVEEMLVYRIKFESLPCDTEYFKKFFEDRMHEILVNKAANPDFTNRDAFRLFELSMGSVKMSEVDK